MSVWRRPAPDPDWRAPHPKMLESHTGTSRTMKSRQATIKDGKMHMCSVIELRWYCVRRHRMVSEWVAGLATQRWKGSLTVREKTNICLLTYTMLPKLLQSTSTSYSLLGIPQTASLKG